MNNIPTNSNNYMNNNITSNVAITQENIYNANPSNSNINSNTTATNNNTNNSTSNPNNSTSNPNNTNNNKNPTPINLNPNFNINPSAIVNPNEIVSIEDQKQYKIQLLLHINSVLLARVIQLTNIVNNNNSNNPNNPNNNISESIQRIISQSLKRVHANLQCISQINQGILHAKPIILDPPDLFNNNNNNNNPPQDILMKLYILMARIFEFW